MKQRDTYVDVAKGIGIMLIVSIHTEVFGVMGLPLSFIAVPVFFLMSGFYDRSERNLGQWFPKSLRTLILPAIIWILIATAYIKLLGYVKDRSWGENPFSLYSMTGDNGPAWFLFALLYTKVLTWGLIKLKTEPTLKSKACLKCLYFTIIIFDLCRYLEYFSYLYTINQTE